MQPPLLRAQWSCHRSWNANVTAAVCVKVKRAFMLCCWLQKWMGVGLTLAASIQHPPSPASETEMNSPDYSAPWTASGSRSLCRDRFQCCLFLPWCTLTALEDRRWFNWHRTDSDGISTGAGRGHCTLRRCWFAKIIIPLENWVKVESIFCGCTDRGIFVRQT